MSPGRKTVVRRIAAVIVGICAAFTLVDGVVQGSWISIGLGVAGAVLLVDWLRPKPPAPVYERIDPATVPPVDVAAATAAASSRVLAVKALREQHPGLGLKDAMDLVDAQLGS